MRGSQGLAADGIPDPSFADQALRRPPTDVARTERGATERGATAPSAMVAR
jgi:hypothetical protein